VLKAIPVPDLPTGGFIDRATLEFFRPTRPGAGLSRSGRRRTTEESKKGDKVSIVITEIP
jgi:DNA gyrase/topoisomerase IV subunit A